MNQACGVAEILHALVEKASLRVCKVSSVSIKQQPNSDMIRFNLPDTTYIQNFGFLIIFDKNSLYFIYLFPPIFLGNGNLWEQVINVTLTRSNIENEPSMWCC